MDKRLELDWDEGDKRAKRSVVIDDDGFAKHLDDIFAKIKVRTSPLTTVQRSALRVEALRLSIPALSPLPVAPASASSFSSILPPFFPRPRRM